MNNEILAWILYYSINGMLIFFIITGSIDLIKKRKEQKEKEIIEQ